jgi:hypothetical protein
MTIPGCRRWVLWRIERGLRRSDPHLAAMLAIFTRLTVGETIKSTEQRSAARRVLAVVAACAHRAMRAIGRACAAMRWPFRGSVRRTVGLPSDSRLHEVVADVLGAERKARHRRAEAEHGELGDDVFQHAAGPAVRHSGGGNRVGGHRRRPDVQRGSGQTASMMPICWR